MKRLALFHPREQRWKVYRKLEPTGCLAGLPEEPGFEAEQWFHGDSVPGVQLFLLGITGLIDEKSSGSMVARFFCRE